MEKNGWPNRDSLDEFGWQVLFGASRDKRLLDQIQDGHLLHALEMSGEMDEYSICPERTCQRGR